MTLALISSWVEDDCSISTPVKVGWQWRLLEQQWAPVAGADDPSFTLILITSAAVRTERRLTVNSSAVFLLCCVLALLQRLSNSLSALLRLYFAASIYKRDCNYHHTVLTGAGNIYTHTNTAAPLFLPPPSQRWESDSHSHSLSQLWCTTAEHEQELNR